MFSRYGCGCVGLLELLAYAIARAILKLITAIYTPLSEVKSMFFKMFCVLWREQLKVFYFEDRGNIFLKKVGIDMALVCGRTQYEFWMLGCVLCQMVKRARKWCCIVSDFHLFLAQN